MISDRVNISTLFFLPFSYTVRISVLDHTHTPHVYYICFFTSVVFLKDKLRHIMIHKVNWSKNQFKLGNAKLETVRRALPAGTRGKT